ncbi:MAG: ABC transporter permease [Planctomycetes bacterium]|nr:ABC transporter permease [Planctomycetota bacterium]
MMTLWQDVRYALRMLARSRGYAAVMVLTLALGIGATTAIFSMVNGILLRPLAYPQSQQLVFIGEFISAFADKYPVLPANARHFLEWRQRCSSFESLSLVGRNDGTMTGRGDPERLETLEVSANLFGTLRVPPALGRVFTAEDKTGANPVAVISDGLWRQKFGANPAILGETITLDDVAYTIVGVLPETFRFPNVNPWAAAVLETSAQPALFVPKVFTERERNRLMADFRYTVIGRLKEGVTPERAAAELNVIGGQIVDLTGRKDLELRAIVKPLKETLVRDSQRGLLVILGAIGTLLLIACLNLGILSLARAQRRDAESAIRAALGATRAQLVRQALAEAVLLALLGSAAGVVVAARGLEVLVRIAPADLPRLSEISIDTGVLVFALGLTGITALLFGALPAGRVAGARAEQVLQAGRRTATTGVSGLRLRYGLIVAEVGLGVVLLTSAGLLLDSFARVMHADLGFQAPTVLAADVIVPPAKANHAVAFHDRLLERLASTVGVDSVALVTALPLEGEPWSDVVAVPGVPKPEQGWPLANLRIVSPGYFQTMGIPLREGRTFEPADRSSGEQGRPRRVVVISERLARSFWPHESTVVGRKVLIDDGEFEIIGVAKDVRAHVDRAAVPMLYRVYWELDLPSATIVVRTRGAPLSLGGAVRAAVHEVDAGIPVAKLRTMRELLETSVSQRRFQMLLTSTFALCALLLASLGVYGVVSYSVMQRTREMGIRAALGAHAPELCALVLRQGMTPVVFGLILGVGGTVACGRLLQSLLYEVEPHDPWIIAGVVTGVLLTALLACYLPARRAARIDPMAALRYE